MFNMNNKKTRKVISSVIILVVVLHLFGGKKIPELMKGIGKGVRSFKDGMKEVKDEIEKEDDTNKK